MISNFIPVAEMQDHPVTLSGLVTFLRAHAAVADKATIHHAYAPAEALAGGIPLGDDCAAIPDGDGYLLFAAEGMLESFVAADPWFAGYSAVMVNLSDVAAMGGWPIAIVDVLWTPGRAHSAEIWAGMTAASQAYGVPIVGGHTTITKNDASYLAAAVLGKAGSLITSFDATPGDDLLIAIDLRGSWRQDKPFWNASVGAPPARLQSDLALLPFLAKNRLCQAGKDISNGGIVGTLAMLLHCSQVGAKLVLDRLPRPANIDLEKWLTSFPSYGYLLAAKPENSEKIRAIFQQNDLACEIVGGITRDPALTLQFQGKTAIF